MKKPLISIERAREILDYDPTTGVLTCKVKRRGVIVPGYVAGCVRKRDGYLVLTLDHRQYKAHRVAWFLFYGVWPEGDIDHIDHDRQNNAIANLRDVPAGVNTENQVRAHKRSKSGLLGVSAHRRKWLATISVRGTKINLGVHETPELAHAAYLAAKRVHHEGNTL